MNKFIPIFLVALGVVVALGAPSGSGEESKSYQLFETVAEKLQKSLWSEEILGKFEEYLNVLKEWSESDEKLQTSSVYDKFREQLKKCSEELQDLKAQPDNCAKQLALKETHEKIRHLFDSVDDEKLRRDWVKKYMNFAVPMRSISRNSNEQFYAFLKETVENYLNAVDTSAQSENLVEWHKKFAKQTDYVKQQKMVMEFMALFPEERKMYEANKCQVQYSTGL
ncbi:uncharacterized protein LOC101901394 [Musca domestica]|uniref:Uncharacterized protein LOC101901394 n=1 Tax=Musca domestica TaxID=7370 RepID=A0A1I8M502_MUSDO|nr:uncharacterized protein LOC101901394 [Musca domestica]